MAIAKRDQLARVSGTLQCELSERLEQPISLTHPLHETLVDEPSEDVEHLQPIEIVVLADSLGSVGRERRREDPEVTEQRTLLRVEQLVAPLDRRQEGS